eukprot:5141110-Prymnesium_polylepis.2
MHGATLADRANLERMPLPSLDDQSLRRCARHRLDSCRHVRVRAGRANADGTGPAGEIFRKDLTS